MEKCKEGSAGRRGKSTTQSSKSRTRPPESQFAVSILAPHEPTRAISPLSAEGRAPSFRSCNSCLGSQRRPAFSLALWPRGCLLGQPRSSLLPPRLRQPTGMRHCAHQTSECWTECSFCIQALNAFVLSMGGEKTPDAGALGEHCQLNGQGQHGQDL